MPFTAATFGRKLATLRSDFGHDLESLAAASGIEVARLGILESAQEKPTGDEVLILADHFRKDFRFFISDQAVDADAGVDLLFREHAGDLSAADRVAIAEFSYLCRSQAFLEQQLGKAQAATFDFPLRGKFFKQQGKDCAAALRKHWGLSEKEVPRDIFAYMRRLGVKVFRRRLENSEISGLFMNHPTAGPCILINYAEGMGRQRFSAAHELGHALLDRKRVTMSKIGEWSSGDLVEVRANTFASNLLIPEALLNAGDKERWSAPSEISLWAENFRVSVPALLSALVGAGLINHSQRVTLRTTASRPADPPDPELEGATSRAQAARWQLLFERGLSKVYVDLCFDAYREKAISRGLLSEMLLATPAETNAIASLFGRAMTGE